MVNETRLTVRARRLLAFLNEAGIDMDGTLGSSTGKRKGRKDVAYKGDRSYHPLVVMLAKTEEV